jgi:hypothetical protein
MASSARRAAVRKNLTVIEEEEEDVDIKELIRTGSGDLSESELSAGDADRHRLENATSVAQGAQSASNSLSTRPIPRSALVPEMSDRVRLENERATDREHIRGLSAQLNETRSALKRALAEIDMLRAHVSSLEITLEERNSEVRRLREQAATAATAMSFSSQATSTSNISGSTVPVVGRDLLGMLRTSAAPAVDPNQSMAVSDPALKTGLPSRLVELRNTTPRATATSPTPKTRTTSTQRFHGVPSNRR